jgi:plasmid stabilization system protein ParE
LAAIHEYIALRNSSGARKVVRAIDRAVELIAKLPRSAPTTELPEIRVTLVAGYPYAVFYRIGADTTEIIHIRHTSRRPWEGE